MEAFADWMADGLCAEHPGLPWFPDRGEDATPALAVCLGCLVRRECLEYALAERIEHGVWGGLTAPQRKRRLRERAA